MYLTHPILLVELCPSPFGALWIVKPVFLGRLAVSGLGRAVPVFPLLLLTLDPQSQARNSVSTVHQHDKSLRPECREDQTGEGEIIGKLQRRGNFFPSKDSPWFPPLDRCP